MGINHVLAAQVAGGGYVSIAKVIPVLLILLVWARLMAWADKDAIAAHLPRDGINSGMMAGLVLAFALFFLVPYYFVALPIILVISCAEAAVYLQMRKKVVGLDDLRKDFNQWLASFSKKKQAAAAAGAVTLVNKAGQTMPVPEAQAPERPAYDAAQLALTEPLKKNAEQIDLDARGEDGASIKYVVDGVSYAGRSVERENGAAAIAYLKEVGGLDVQDRRKPQSGSIKASMDGRKIELKVQTAGSTAGEYMRLLVDPKRRHDFQLDQLGFTEKQLATVKQSIADNAGVVILSAPKAMGLTSLQYGILRGHDAFLQHIQTVERDPEQDLEGITQNKLPGNASAADEYKMAGWVISQEPDVMLINQVEDRRSAADLINYAKANGRRVYVAMRASSTFEALDQWRRLLGDDALAMDQLRLIINGRVIRKLCVNCKVGYAPDPGTLKKLGMNPEKVKELFQARTEPLRDPKGNPLPCEFCQDLRFKGRTGVFELMTVDDEMRQAVAAGRPVEQVFRKQRGRFLQEEALGLVERSETSVQEVKRVLRPTADAPPIAAGSSGGAAAPRRPAPQPGVGGPTQRATA